MVNANLVTHRFGKVNTRFSLVNSILEDPDQVANILHDNEEILDYALIQLLENTCEYMKTQNRFQTVQLLKDVISQIQQYLSFYSIN